MKKYNLEIYLERRKVSKEKFLLVTKTPQAKEIFYKNNVIKVDFSKSKLTKRDLYKKKIIEFIAINLGLPYNCIEEELS